MPIFLKKMIVQFTEMGPLSLSLSLSLSLPLTAVALLAQRPLACITENA